MRRGGDRVQFSDSLVCVLAFNINNLPLRCFSFVLTGATLQTTLSEEQTAEHAAMLSQLTTRASNLVRDLDPTDELSMLRVRSRNREIMIAPDKEFILIVIQNPHVGESS